jgi:hypothetical protein
VTTIVLAACGNGVPQAPGDNGNTGGACATNDDCVSSEICVSGTCTPLSASDGGSDAGTADAGTTDAGPSDGGMQTCTTDTWGNFAQNIIVTECLACHDHSHNFSNSYTSVRNNRSSMRADINNGSMPRYPQSLTADQKTRILKWFDCSLPQ